MSFFNNINRFAGDAVGNIGENIGTGYKAADNTVWRYPTGRNNS